jgi:hypothetical protein
MGGKGGARAAGRDVTRPVSGEEVIGYLRARQITLTDHPRTGTLQAGTHEAVKTIIRKAS